MRDLSRGCDCGAVVGESEVRLGLGETDSLAGFQFSDGGGENAWKRDDSTPVEGAGTL